MGVVAGPLDPRGDDALFGDVPIPNTELVQAALAPAYIEVDPTSTQFDSPNVAFDAHVPDSLALSEPERAAQLYNQANLGRQGVSWDGEWWMYIQGAYESFDELDNDPASEPSWMGASILQGPPAFVCAETIRDTCLEWPGRLEESFAWQMYALHEALHEFGLPDSDANNPPNAMSEAEVFQGDLTNIPVPLLLPWHVRIVRCRESQVDASCLAPGITEE